MPSRLAPLVRLAAIVAVALGAAPAWGQAEAVARAEARLAAGDSSAAHAVVAGALHREPDGPDAAALLRLRLVLERARVGLGAVPPPFRVQQIIDSARRLVARDPSDALARRTLLDADARTVLDFRDRINPTRDASAFVSAAEQRTRLNRSRFNLAERDAMAPAQDASGPARSAARDADAQIEALLAAGAMDAPAADLAFTAYAATERWAEAAALATRLDTLVQAGLVLGLARHRLGDAAGAEAAFRRALPRLALDERARLLNVRTLLTPAEQAAYDADPEGVADAFWTREDPRLLSDTRERWTEHLARSVEADLRFGRPARDLFTDRPRRGIETAPGRIWVRYGPPLRAAEFTLSEGDLPSYAGDYTPMLGTPPYRVWEYEDFRFVFDDPLRNAEFRTYSPPASAFASDPRAASGDDYVAQDRRLQREDPQRTQAGPDDPLSVPVLASRLRAEGGGTRVVVGYGVPLAAPPPGPTVPLAVRSGVFVLDGGRVAAEERRAYASLPSGRVLAAREATVWADAASVRLVGETVRVEVETAGGARSGATTVALEPLPASGFGLSDLLLAAAADEDGTGPIRVGDLAVWPAPWGVFATLDPIPVVVEVYGLALRGGRSDYAVEASLTPADRRRGLGRIFGRRRAAGVAVAFDAQGDRATEATLTVLDASGQAPGRYTLTFAVTDRVTGQTAAASREIVLEE